MARVRRLKSSEQDFCLVHTSQGTSDGTKGGTDGSMGVPSDDELDGDVSFFLHTCLVGELASGVVYSSFFSSTSLAYSLTSSLGLGSCFFFDGQRRPDLFFFGCS